MSTGKKQRSVSRLMAAGAVVVGLAAGSYGIASAATGSTGTTQSSGNAARSDRSAPSAQHPWGGQRSDETPLTGETLTKVRQAALAKADNGTIERVETDADGHAAYEAHVIRQDGTPVTVYVDKQFNVVGVETR
jgi:hypothetical protein